MLLSKLSVNRSVNLLFFYLFFSVFVLIFIFKPPFHFLFLNALFIHIYSLVVLIFSLFYRLRQKYIIIFFVFLFPLSYLTIVDKVTATYPFVVALFSLLIISDKFQFHNYSCRNLTHFILISTVLFSFFFLYESHIDRYLLVNGDPNYTSLILLTVLLVSFVFSVSNKFKVLVLLLMFFAIYLTKSRTAILALAAFFLCCKIKRKLLLFYFILFVSIVSQYFFSYIFPSILSDLDFGHSRFFDLNDASNIERITIYKEAVDFISSHFTHFLINGVTNYLEINKLATNIPHNWFVQFILGFGFLFSIYYLVVVVFVAKIVSGKSYYLLAFMCFFFVYASFLSYYSLATPLLFLVLFLFVCHSIEKLAR